MANSAEWLQYKTCVETVLHQDFIRNSSTEEQHFRNVLSSQGSRAHKHGAWHWFKWRALLEKTRDVIRRRGVAGEGAAPSTCLFACRVLQQCRCPGDCQPCAPSVSIWGYSPILSYSTVLKRYFYSTKGILWVVTLEGGKFCRAETTTAKVWLSAWVKHDAASWGYLQD